MKKIKFKKFLGILLLTSTVIFACKKESNVLTEVKLSKSFSSPPSGYNTIQDYRNQLREWYGEALAKSLSDVRVRTFVKHKIQENPTVETEFLHAQFMNDIVFSGYTFNEILAQNSAQPDSLFSIIIPTYDPRMTILIPDNYLPNSWDTSIYIPNVIASKTEYDDTTSIYLAAFDTSGRVSDIVSSVQPNDMVIVIAETETLVPFSKPYTGMNQNLIYSNDWYDYYFIDGVVSVDGESESVKYVSPLKHYSRSCERDNSNKHDLMYAYKINGSNALKSIESWFRGKPEMYFFAVYNTSIFNPIATTVKKIMPQISRHAASNQNWQTMNIPIIKWASYDPMDQMKYIWMERDGGSAKTMPISLSVTVAKVSMTLSTNVQISKDDDEAGESLIYYCDQINWGGQDYNTGIVSFNIRQ